MSSLPREIAGRYTVRSPIGEGAYSITYRAVDTALQRDVAIKVLREQYAAHEGFDSRFEREARSAARISHPNVISVYDYGRQGHLPYIVMQYVDGPNLKEYVREEGPLTIEESINFARQILDGLSAIHDEGIVHRDVKPQNVLIDTGLQAKITDFGVAFVNVEAGLTETGMAVGTAAYMAPEQASGEAVGPPADLYAVGVILYEMLTGRLPFPGENPVQVMYRHVNEMPQPPRAINHSVPMGVEAVVLKALAKDAHDRFPDARTMADALVSPGNAMVETIAAPSVPAASSSQSGQWSSAPTVAPRRRRPPPRRYPAAPAAPSTWPVVLLVLLIIGLVVILVLLLQSDRFAGWGSGAESTPTVQVAASGDPTPSDEVPAVDTGNDDAPAPPPPDATLEPEPGGDPVSEVPDESADQEPEINDDGSDAEESASLQFNTPFDARLLPPQWSIGESRSITAADLLAAGATEAGDDFPAPGARIDEPVDASFNVLGLASNYIGITLAGMTSPDGGETPMRLYLNGNMIWSGPAPFDAGEWTEVGWRLGNLEWLVEGDNVLTIEVLPASGTILVSNVSIFYG